MLKTAKLIHDLHGAWATNGFFYYLSKIPLVGKFIPEKIYGMIKIKGIWNRILFFLTPLFQCIRKGLYYSVFFLGPMMYFGKSQIHLTANDFLQMFFALNIFLGMSMNHPLAPAAVVENYVLTQFLDVDTRKYFFLRVIKFYLNYFIFHGLILALISKWVPEISFGKFLTGLFFVMGVRGIWDFYMMGRFKRTGRMNMPKVLAVLFGATGIGLYVQPLFFRQWVQLNFWDKLITPWSAMLLFLLGIASYLMLWKNGEYNRLARYEASYVEEMSEKKADFRTQVGTLTQEKDFRMVLSPATAQKKGYAYLHSIFFQRNYKIIGKKVLRKLYFIGGAFLVLVGMALFFPKGQEMTEKFLSGALSKMGFWFFVVNFFCLKADYNAILFNNMDRCLLNYNFYRRPKDVLTCFSIRLKRVLLYNFSLAVLTCLGFLILAKMHGKVLEVLPLLGLICLLTFFFSVHYLALYYLTQPYTEQSNAKSPVYSIANMAVYWGSWILFMKKNIPNGVIWWIAAAIFVYTLCILFVVVKKAPKTFRLHR